MRSTRDAIADTLADLLAAGEPSPSDPPTRFRNLLLDACGSDHRALVELLLRVGRHGMADTLRNMAVVSPARWPERRAPLVARITGELYVDAEIAAWTVDTWAVALGVVPRDAVQQLQSRHAAERVQQAAQQRVEEKRANQPAGRSRGMRPVPAPRATGAVRPGIPGAPSWAGGSSVGRLGALPGNQRMVFIPRWQGSSGPVHVPNVRRNLGVMAAVMFVAVLVVLLTPRDPAAASDGAAEPDVADAPAGAESPDSAEVPAANVGAVTEQVIRRAALGNTADAPTGVLPRPIPMPAALPPASATRADLDTIRMDDGRTLIGAIRLVAPTMLYVHDVGTGLEYGLPVSRVQSVTTRTGAALALTRGASSGAAVSPSAVSPVSDADALIAAGVGGTYRVEQRVRSVDGNSLCAPVAAALGRDVIHSVEEVLHAPGSNRFEFTTRPGVRGSIDPAAHFATEPYVASRDGVQFVFRMSGQFVPGGFSARTITETQAVIGYRRTQTCRIMADLLATRTLDDVVGADGVPGVRP